MLKPSSLMADPVSTEQWPTSIEGWRRLYLGLDEHYTLPETEVCSTLPLGLSPTSRPKYIGTNCYENNRVPSPSFASFVYH